VDWPEGERYLVFTAGGGPYVDGDRTNNRLAVPVRLLERPAEGPRLELVDSELRRTGDSSAKLTYTIENTGSAAAPGPWTDTLFYMTGQATGLDHIVTLGTARFEGSLAPGADYTRVLSPTFPGRPSASRMLFVGGMRGTLQELAALNVVTRSADLRTEPDLTVRIPSGQGQPLIPGHPVSIAVRVGNACSSPSGAFKLELFASRNRELSESDIPLATLDVGSLAGGGGELVNLRFTVPGSLRSGLYRLIAVVDGDERVVELDAGGESNNQAVTGPAYVAVLKFGSFDGRKNVKLTITDPAGTPMTLSLTKGGYGEVTLEAGLPVITLHDTIAASSFRLSVPRGEATAIAGVLALGPLNTFAAGAAELRGDFAAAMPIKNVELASAVDGTITASRIGSLRVAGDFGAELGLTEASDVALGKLIVGGWLDGSVIRSGGAVGLISVGGVRNSQVLLGVEAGAADLFDETPDLLAPVATLGSFVVRGIPGSSAPSFIASTIGKVRLREVSVDNAGAPFGIVAEVIDSLWMPGEVGLIRLSDLDTGLAVEEADFRVRLV
jgi:hypothetical protein